MKKEIEEILDGIQYDDFYQKTFEASKGYKTLVDELNYAEKCHNLEEEIGCSLNVLFKALINGVYYEDVANHMKYMPVDLHINLEGYYVLYFADEEWLLTENYKKTWWLKEDRSE